MLALTPPSPHLFKGKAPPGPVLTSHHSLTAPPSSHHTVTTAFAQWPLPSSSHHTVTTAFVQSSSYGVVGPRHNRRCLTICLVFTDTPPPSSCQAVCICLYSLKTTYNNDVANSWKLFFLITHVYRCTLSHEGMGTVGEFDFTRRSIIIFILPHILYNWDKSGKVLILCWVSWRDSLLEEIFRCSLPPEFTHILWTTKVFL